VTSDSRVSLYAPRENLMTFPDVDGSRAATIGEAAGG